MLYGSAISTHQEQHMGCQVEKNPLIIVFMLLQHKTVVIQKACTIESKLT